MGEAHTIGGAVIICKYQRQKNVTQSSTEAEYITLSESVKEHKSTQMILQQKSDIETPGYIYGDN